jgi:hypothetical protein
VWDWYASLLETAGVMFGWDTFLTQPEAAKWLHFWTTSRRDTFPTQPEAAKCLHFWTTSRRDTFLTQPEGLNAYIFGRQAVEIPFWLNLRRFFSLCSFQSKMLESSRWPLH